MGEDYKKEIEEIIGQLKCPKDFSCYKSGFEVLCKVEDIGMELFLECLEKNPSECKFSLFLGRSCFCRCPLRIYINKKVKK
jgi:hypothetical protein